MVQDNVTFETVYIPKYSSTLSSVRDTVGEWAVAEGRVTVWTDGSSAVGILPTPGTEFAGSDFAELNTLRGSADSAQEVFLSMVDYLEDASGQPMARFTGQLSDITTNYQEVFSVENDERYGITVDESENVLEFVKINSEGVFLRSAGEWIRIEDDAEEEDYPTFYDQSFYDTTEDALSLFDSVEDNDSNSLEDFKKFVTE